MKFIIALLILLTPLAARADGLMFDKSGRVPVGGVTVITLTKEQIDFLDYYFMCLSNKYNYETPYIFFLNKEQQEKLKNETGFTLSRFAVSSSYNKDRGIELDFNVINRYSKSNAEIPHKILATSKEAEYWEYNIIEWSRTSRFYSVTKADIESGICVTPNKSLKSDAQ